MRVARFVVGLIVLLWAMFGPGREASACSCPSSGPPCQSVFQTDVIFAGTVQSISALPDDDLPPLRPGESRIPSTLRVEFSEVQGYRGLQSSAATVLTAGGGASCGYGFTQGGRYLVYATRRPDGTGLVTGICSRTRPLADAAEDLRFLRTLSESNRAGARVYGTMNHWERDLSSGTGRDYGPVAGVFVSVLGPPGNFSASTDERGRFEVVVPPGKYEVTAHPPAEFSTRYLQSAVELADARACAVADFNLRFDGRIRGFVRQSSGEPAANVVIQAVAAEDVGKSGNVQMLSVQSDAGGSFEFSEVSPGRYVVGVDLVRRMDPKIVFPSTFYPGTMNPTLTTVIQLDGGQHRDLEPMTLPPPRRAFVLRGTVVHEDGTPESSAVISLRDGIEKWRQVAVGTKTGTDGSFSFVVYEGLSYTASATYWDAAERKQSVGNLGPFVVTQDMGPVKVVLSSGR